MLISEDFQYFVTLTVDSGISVLEQQSILNLISSIWFRSFALSSSSMAFCETLKHYRRPYYSFQLFGILKVNSAMEPAWEVDDVMETVVISLHN